MEDLKDLFDENIPIEEQIKIIEGFDIDEIVPIAFEADITLINAQLKNGDGPEITTENLSQKDLAIVSLVNTLPYFTEDLP